MLRHRLPTLIHRVPAAAVVVVEVAFLLLHVCCGLLACAMRSDGRRSLAKLLRAALLLGGLYLSCAPVVCFRLRLRNHARGQGCVLSLVNLAALDRRNHGERSFFFGLVCLCDTRLSLHFSDRDL